MTELWTRWQPVQELLKGEYYIIFVNDSFNDGKVEIKLVCSTNKNIIVKVIFEKTVKAYTHYTEEMLWSDIWSNISCENQKEVSFEEWSFYKIKNSTYIKWLFDQSQDILNITLLQHFVIANSEEKIDIIATNEPIFEIEVNKNSFQGTL